MKIFEISTGDIERQIDGLRDVLSLVKGGLPLAAQRAANKTVQSLKVQTRRAVQREYNVRAVDLETGFSVHHASRWNPQAELHVSGQRSVSLSRFNPRIDEVEKSYSLRPSAAPRTMKLKTVKVKIKRSGGHKLVQGAFPNASGAIFKREGEERVPIKKLFGPSPLRMVEDSGVQLELEHYAQESMEKNLEQEATFILKKAGLR